MTRERSIHGAARIHFAAIAEIRLPPHEAGVLRNGGHQPGPPARRLRPTTFRDAVEWADGSVGPGVVEPCMLWLVEAAGMRILFDAGMGEEHVRHVNSAVRARGLDQLWVHAPEHDVDRFLADRGASPEAVDVVVLSHLHLDHCANVGAYRNARVIVHERELAMALAPPPYADFHWPEFSRYVVDVLGRVETIRGTTRLCEGVTLLHVGGHSVGQLAMVVETAVGRVVLASDFFTTYTNIEHAWPPGICPYLDQWEDSCADVMRAGDVIVPGHDDTVFERYPEGTIGG